MDKEGPGLGFLSIRQGEERERKGEREKGRRKWRERGAVGERGRVRRGRERVVEDAYRNREKGNGKRHNLGLSLGFLSFREGREKRERGREKKGEGKGEREWSVGQRGRARREFEKEVRGRERGGGRRI